MACVARATRGSLIYILEMLSLRIEPRNFEGYLYITVSYILFFVKHYIITLTFFDKFHIILLGRYLLNNIRKDLKNNGI